AQGRHVIPFRYHAVRNLSDQVGALLAGKSRHNPDEGGIHGFRGQAKLPDQFLFADSFAAQIRGRVVGRDQAVRRRVPLRVVDSIEDAGQHATARAQYAVQAKPVFRGLDLARVGRADCIQIVTVIQPAFEVTDLSKELDSLGNKNIRIRQVDLGKGLRRKQTGVPE